MRIGQIGEFGLIDLLKRSVPVFSDVVKGIGDDAAVLPYTKDKYLLFTTDMLIEGVHFIRKAPMPFIGHKALACNISDIAAMGGLPTYAVISIALPKQLKVSDVKGIYQGMGRLASKFGVSIVGGDTVKSDKLVINIALLGEVRKKDLALRSGAKAGDLIVVSGPLGGSLTSGRHLRFTPRLKEAQWLVKHVKPTAMMDISDGLAGDLNHILRASRVGAVLDRRAIPRHQGVSIKQALTDGEDFELLFTAPKTKEITIRKTKKFFIIGAITSNPSQLIHEQSFTHF